MQNNKVRKFLSNNLFLSSFLAFISLAFSFTLLLMTFIGQIDSIYYGLTLKRGAVLFFILFFAIIFLVCGLIATKYYSSLKYLYLSLSHNLLIWLRIIAIIILLWGIFSLTFPVTEFGRFQGYFWMQKYLTIPIAFSIFELWVLTWCDLHAKAFVHNIFSKTNYVFSEKLNTHLPLNKNSFTKRSQQFFRENHVINKLKISFLHLKDTFYSHICLLKISKSDLLSYFSSPFRIILIILFSILFLPHVFVVVKDINFITAYEVDPGSIISSILSLYSHSYNMNAAYHSKYYGWTYYSISYFLLIPIYLAQKLKLLTSDYFFFVGLRFIFFSIGLSSVLAFYEIAKRTLKQNMLAFIGAILFIISPTVFRYFYFLHPESTASLFLFLSILCLLQFIKTEAKDYRWYTFGLLTLVLCVLSKQTFIFIAWAVPVLFIIIYCQINKLFLFRYIFSKQFLKLFLYSILLSLIVFFIINPYAFIQPKIFIGNQILLFSTHTQGTKTFVESIYTWITLIKGIPVIFLSGFLFPILIIGSLIFGHKNKIGTILFITNTMAAIIFTTIIFITSKFSYTEEYLAPAYPFFVLSLLYVPLFIIRKWNKPLVKFVTLLPLIYFLFIVLVGDFSTSIHDGYNRLMYKNTDIYKVYEYIEEYIPDGSKIAHDHLVAIPSDKNITGCHFWQGCGTDYIEEFEPDYIIFDKDYYFNGVHLPTQRLLQYVEEHHFIIIDTINKIDIWKKPLN